MVPGTEAFDGQEGGEFVLDDSTEVNGLPVFRGNVDADSGKGVQESYAFIYWGAKRQINEDGSYSFQGTNKWQIAETLDDARNGEAFGSLDGLPGASCSGSLLQRAPPRGPATPARAPAKAGRKPRQWFYRNGKPVDAAGEHFAALEALAEKRRAAQPEEEEEEEEDDGTCGAVLDRFNGGLDNGADIASSGEDELFPESEESISTPGADCGDSAAGISNPCSNYNNWKSLAEIRSAKEEADSGSDEDDSGSDEDDSGSDEDDSGSTEDDSGSTEDDS